MPAELPGLAIQQGLTRLGNNEKLFLQLLGDLLKEYAGAATTLAQLVAEDKQDELRAAAHKIRGIANNLGAVDIGNCAEAIERTVIAGETVTPQHIASLAAALTVAAESHAQLRQRLLSMRNRCSRT